MNLSITLATARRILTQLRHDPATVGTLVIVPAVLLALLRYVFDSPEVFGRVAPALLGLFPFMLMFMAASITTLRERTTATLERLMTMPMGRLDLLAGYALAFGIVAVVQVGVLTAIAVTWLDIAVTGSFWLLVLVALLDALLGMALGLFVSAFARTEFQAIQSMPIVVMPQILLCGLFIPRDQMAPALNDVSEAMPLAYAVDALTQVTVSTDVGGELMVNISVVAGCTVLALLLGAASLRRRTP